MSKKISTKEQVQITENLYVDIYTYIRDKNISFETFCKELNMPVYMMEKIVDPAIKMSASPELFDRIFRHIHSNSEQNVPKIHF